MKVLIAEDEPVSRRLLETRLGLWGYDVQSATDGAAALEVLSAPDGPQLAILDWMMPVLDGLEVCRRARDGARERPLYMLLLTARSTEDDLVAGLDAGANDYLTKPFRAGELRARLRAGERVIAAEMALAARVSELEQALAEVSRLRGLLPICASCKRIRDGQDYWHQIETYISAHSEARFTHGLCPSCFESAMAELKREA